MICRGVHWYCKRENSVQQSSWPARSPDFNPIENVWAYMKRQLEFMVLDHENLEKAVVDSWNKVPTELSQILYHSMPNRVNHGLKNQGFPTKY